MKCSVCDRPRPINPWVTGIWYDMKSVPRAVAYRCRCGNNRDIPWPDASREQRQQAYLAEMSRQTSEMGVWGG